jgi:sterol desaturase/sphingolipid hydroxylase (fatty acid hydroxylase superfamily)
MPLVCRLSRGIKGQRMASFLVFILLIFCLNMWLAITTLLALTTGVAKINGRRFRREQEPGAFWISVSSRALAAVVFFCYLVSVVARVLHASPWHYFE